MNREEEEDRLAKYGGAKQCGCCIFWVFCVTLYILQFVFGIWSAVLQFLMSDYVMFGVLVTPLLAPTLAMTVISLVWYWDQDKVNKYLQATHPDDRELHHYRPLIGVGTVLSHITGLGVLYR